MPSAFALVLLWAVDNNAARTAMMATTTCSSTSVKAGRLFEEKVPDDLIGSPPPAETDIRICQDPELLKVTVLFYWRFRNLSTPQKRQKLRVLGSLTPSLAAPGRRRRWRWGGLAASAIHAAAAESTN